jgi:mannose-P-dolichol utilization defect protein 1
MKGHLLFSALLLLLLLSNVHTAPLRSVADDDEYILPNLISVPLVKLLGKECYVSLIEELHVTDVPCVKLAISKGLGLGIVVGGAIIKIPQIITIVKHTSVQGLSFASFLLETCAYEIVLMYNTRLSNPFSTYGEVFFMTIQNLIICGLIAYLGKPQYGWAAMMGLIVGFVTLMWIPSWLMSVLYAAQIPIGLASKVPQIRANYINESTGQLSVFAVLNYFFGTSARTFTTYTELDDPIMLGGNLLATVLNGVLVFQVVYYWKNRPIVKSD